MNDIGHNQPQMAETAKETMQSLSDWMAENPSIQDEEAARSAKLLVDRGKLALADMEDERKAKVGPLNEQIKAINDGYRAPRGQLETVIAALSSRITAYLHQIEQERIEMAQRARKAAEEAEERAREAERKEQEAIGSADTGELDVDIASAVLAADESFSAYKKAERQAQRAEREAENVKIGGGFRRSLSLRETETLVVVDGMKAILRIGITDGITEAIIKDARAYRKLHGHLPDGVQSVKERMA